MPNEESSCYRFFRILSKNFEEAPNGELPMYYIANNHPDRVEKAVFTPA